MKLWKKLKNWRLSEKDKSIYLPLETIHLELDLEKLKRKSLMRYFTLIVFRCPDPVQIIFEEPTASVLFIFLFFNIAYVIYRTCDIYRICDISYLRYISHMRYCKCEIMTSKVGKVLKKKY